VVITPRVVSPHCTDYGSLDAILSGPRFAGKAGGDLAVAIWQFIVDAAEGVYHFWPSLERLNGWPVCDTIKLLNSFGWTICGQNANLIATLWRAAGLDARLVGIDGHRIAEVFYDGAWHLLDGDLKAFHRKHPPDEDVIAAVADCVADPTLISRQQNPSRPYYVSDRAPEKMADLYRVEPAYDVPFDERALTMDFALRPGERLERHTANEGKFIWFDNYTEAEGRYKKEWARAGPWERHPPHRTFGNGKWVYEPRLTDVGSDFEAGVFAAEGVECTPAGLAPARKGRQWCVFDFDSPWPYAGVPDPTGERPPADGCVARAVVSLASSSSTVRILLSVDPDLPWTTVWESRRRGRHAVDLDLTPHVVNAHRYRLRFEFDAARKGSCRLERLRVESAFMIAPMTVGRLVEVDNPLTVRFGDERGEPTRRTLTAVNFRDADDLPAKAHRLVNLRAAPDTDDLVAPQDPAKDYEMVFKIDAPPTGVLRRVYALAAVRGRAPGDGTGDDRVAAYVAQRESGPWREVFFTPVPPHPQRWHVCAQGQADLTGRPKTVFVKFVGRAGLSHLKIRSHWLEERARGAAAPVLVRHVWDEACGCTKIHAERIPSPRRPHEYRITCGPAPVLRSLVMEVESTAR